MTAGVLVLALSLAAGSGDATRTVAELRVHGNHSIPDDQVLSWAGVAVGDPLSTDAVAAIRARLRETGRFDEVEVHERYRSLTAGDRVALIIEVAERPPVKDRFLWLPMLDFDENWGFTYGARVAAEELLGWDERIEAAAGWGGVKQLTGALTRSLRAVGFDRIELRGGISRREHPTFEEDLDRVALGAGVSRRFGLVRAGLNFGWSDVELGVREDDRLLSYSAELAFDSRDETSFPRDAVYAQLRAGGLRILDGGPTFGLLGAELRGYKGLFGGSVLAMRAAWEVASERLPDHARRFVGGAETLRGHRAGEFLGDNLAWSSLELRVPLNSPLDWAKVGVHGFVDTATAYPHDVAVADAEFQHGVGVGAFLLATVVKVRVDVAYDLEDSWRVHLSSGFRF